jgi:tetratricopeptide (TPR) repeat protein
MEDLEAATLTGMGVNARDQGRLAASLEYLEAAELIDRRLGATPRLALTLRFVGLVHFMLGNRARAEAALDECYELFSELGHKGGMGWALEGKARLSFQFDETPDYDAAQRAAELYSEVHDRRNQAWLLLRTASARRKSGEPSASRADVEQSLEIFVELGDNRGTAYAVTQCGLLALHDGDLVRAGEELRQGLALFAKIGDAGGVSASHGYLSVLAVLNGAPTAARDHAATWLSHPAGDRYVWFMADVLDALADGLDARGAHDTTVDSLAVAYRAAVEAQELGASTKVDLTPIPEVLLAALSRAEREKAG